MRIAVFGGSFDPVHAGHTAVADAVQRSLRPELFLWVPARAAPHKLERPLAPADARRALLEKLVAERPGEKVCTLELERPGPSYTVDTLEELARRYPGAELLLILGADSQEHLPGWRRLSRVRELARLVFVPRPGWTELGPEAGGLLLPMELAAVSSTEVRERLARGASCAGMLPAVVEQEIRRRGLYQS